jgi:hypothetical protein
VPSLEASSLETSLDYGDADPTMAVSAAVKILACGGQEGGCLPRRWQQLSRQWLRVFFLVLFRLLATNCGGWH